jgi:RNA polymerase sigma factor (sigma-70 family)
MAPAQSSAIEQLLTERSWVRGLARNLVGEMWADDLVQETMLAAMRAPPEPGLPARPWLARVVRNLGLMHLRSRARSVAREEAVRLEPAATQAPDEHVTQLQTQHMLCEVLLELAEPFRRTMVEHYFHGRSFAEIARREGSPEGTVRWRHKEGLERLRHALDQRSGGDRRAWALALVPFIPSKASATTVAGILGVTLMKKMFAGGLVLLLAAVVTWLISPSLSPRQEVAAAKPERIVRPPVHLLWPSSGPAMLAAAPASSLAGNVVGAEGKPVQVSLLRHGVGLEEPSIVARGQGERFDFGALAAGTYCVTAQAEGRQGSVCGIRLEQGERRVQDVSLSPAGLRLRGVVRDAGAGTVPMPRITARPHPSLDGVVSSLGRDNGGYELALQPGWYRVSASGNGYTSVTRLIELTGDRELDFFLNPAGQLSGRVIDAESGAPAAGATVVARSDTAEPKTVHAGPDGRFEFSGLGSGRFRLFATLNGRYGAGEEVALTPGESRQSDIRISQRGVSLEGKVVEVGTGRPLPESEVWLRGTAEWSARTDEAGRFRIDGLVPDEYEITATASDFVLGRQQVLVSEQGRSGVVLALHKGAAVHGRVTLASGAPVAEAVVESSAWALGDPRLVHIRTRADGTFTLKPIEPGRVKLAAYHPEHGLTRMVDVMVTTGESAPVQLSFTADASVSGTVRFDDGSTAAGALVTLSSEQANAAWTTTANADGSYRVESLPAGAYSVSIRSPSAWSEDSVVHDPAKVQLELSSGERKVLDLRVPGGHERIQGRVVDASGSPVAGASVWAERLVEGAPTGSALGGVEVYTLDDGSFSLEGLPRGEYLIGARHVEHARGTLSPIRAGASGVVVALRSPGRVVGRVLDQGRPVTTFKLSWRGGSRVFVDPQGRFELTGLDPAEHQRVSAETPEGKWGASKKFALGAGERIEVQIDVKSQGVVRGRLVDPRTGQGAVGLQVFFGFDALTRTDGQGLFEVRLPVGRYERFFAMSSTADLPPISRVFEVKPGETTDLGEVLMPSGTSEAEEPEH